MHDSLTGLPNLRLLSDRIGQDGLTLMKHADDAIYQSKGEGGNRVTVYRTHEFEKCEANPMIQKDELIEKLKVATISDAYLISVYANHIRKAIPYSTLKKEAIDAILDALQKRKEVSDSHEVIINNLVASISNSDKNVY